MPRISSLYLNGVSETLNLIHRLLDYLEKKGKQIELVNFLSQIEVKANIRINSVASQYFSNPSLPVDQDGIHLDFWRGVRDTVKAAKLQFLTDSQDFSLYLSAKRTEIHKAQKHLQADGTNILPITHLVIQGGKISVLGLDRAGKTSIFQRLKTGRWIPDTQPTIGMNAETIQINNVQFIAWDLGGQMQFRNALWDMYTKNSVGLIYVIDASDPMRFPEARRNLQRMLEKTHLQDLPLAIFTNKMDILHNKREVFSTTDLANSMGITKKMDRSLKIFKTSAKTGEGISEGIYWLVDAIIMNMNQGKEFDNTHESDGVVST